MVPVLLVMARAWAQQEETPTFSEELEVAEVLIDVLVTDSDGRVVIGLGPEDFTVEDDGHPVELTGVEFYSSAEWIDSPANLTAGDARIDVVPRQRYFIVYLQLQQRVAGQVPGILSRQMEAIRDLDSWIADTLQPEDWVAIVAFDTRLHVVSDFSRNLEALRRSLNEVSSADLGRDRDWPSRSAPTGRWLR